MSASETPAANTPPPGGPLPGERTGSAGAGRRGAGLTGTRAVAVIATGAIVLVVLVFARGSEKPKAAQADYAVRQHVTYEPARLPPLPVTYSEPAPTLRGTSPQLPPQLVQQSSQTPSPMDKARVAPVMEFASDQGSGAAGPGIPGSGGLPTDSAGSLSANLVASRMDGSKATTLPHRNMLVTMGTVLPCVLETAIDSTLPGFSTCMVPRDVLSDDSTVVLMEKGTKVVGEFKGGVRQGQRRIFIIWTRAETPKGVIINLGSPAVDPVGRAGVDGTYASHFWERFGGALLFPSSPTPATWPAAPWAAAAAATAASTPPTTSRA